MVNALMPGPDGRYFHGRLSTSTPSVHPEDLQPNEAINKRKQKQPPSLMPTSGAHRHKPKPWSQQAGRGNTPWRGSNVNRGRTPVRHRPHSHVNHAANRDKAESSSSRGSRLPSYEDSRFAQEPVASHRLPPALRVPHSSASSFRPPLPPLHSNPGQFVWAPTSQISTIPPSLSPHPDAASKTSPLPRTPSPAQKPLSLELPYLTREFLPLAKRQKVDHEFDAPVKKEEHNEGILSIPAAAIASRQKVDHDFDAPVKKEEHNEDILSIPAAAIPSQAVIKTESRSPSPSLPTRRLVTTSCNWYPLPKKCRKTNPDYLKHRQMLVRKECRVLKRFDLKVTNMFFRDDGMVIEWSSSVPVWSDTYLPERAENISEAPDVEYIGLVSEDEADSPSQPLGSRIEDSASTVAAPPEPTPSTKPLPKRKRVNDITPWNDSPVSVSTSSVPAPAVSPSPSSYPGIQRMEVSPRPAWKQTPPRRPQLLSQPPPPPQDTDVIPSERSGLGQPPAPPARPGQLPITKIGKVWPAEELSEVEPLAIDFLQQYLRSFDTSIQTLTKAYAPTALLTHRGLDSSVSQTMSSTASGHSEIRQALASLASFKFCPNGPEPGTRPPRVQYDVVSLGIEAGGGILLAAYGEIMNISSARRAEGVFSISQSFALQKPKEKPGDVGIEHGKDKRGNDWPLIIVAHQMVMRPVTCIRTWMDSDGVDSVFPWIS